MADGIVYQSELLFLLGRNSRALTRAMSSSYSKYPSVIILDKVNTRSYDASLFLYLSNGKPFHKVFIDFLKCFHTHASMLINAREPQIAKRARGDLATATEQNGD